MKWGSSWRGAGFKEDLLFFKERDSTVGLCGPVEGRFALQAVWGGGHHRQGH